MPYYLVELYVPSADAREPQRSAARARAGAQELTRDGIDARYLTSIFVPNDEICFHLIEAPSADVVWQASERTRLEVARVSEVRLVR
jgi:hypothetical protein